MKFGFALILGIAILMFGCTAKKPKEGVALPAIRVQSEYQHGVINGLRATLELMNEGYHPAQISLAQIVKKGEEVKGKLNIKVVPQRSSSAVSSKPKL